MAGGPAHAALGAGGYRNGGALARIAALDDVQDNIAACGHTHVQMLRKTATTTLVNPGSVGLGGTGPGTPDLPPPRPASGAEFAVLDVVDEGMSVAFHHLELDIGAMIEAARASGMPEVSGWARLWTS